MSQPVGSGSRTILFYVIGFAALAANACSSTAASQDAGAPSGSGGALDGVGGGGAGGQAGSASDAGRDVGPDATIYFDCGGDRCIQGQSYCRIRSGYLLLDGGRASSTSLCITFSPSCNARDCSCVAVNQGDTYCSPNSCEQAPSGGLIAHCDPI
jgi:hypothetical protein